MHKRLLAVIWCVFLYMLFLVSSCGGSLKEADSKALWPNLDL